MRRYDLRPSKGLGQNFLVDEHHLERIVATANLTPNDLVIEIGPGLGVLTQQLAAQAGQVVAIEKDRKLQAVLAETLAAYPNVDLLFDDALQVDYVELVGEASAPKVVANLPYYITTPLIMGLLEQGPEWHCLVFLVQKEVAARMAADPGGKDYGALSVGVQFRQEAEIVAQVPPSAFYPVPKVASTVVRLQPRDMSQWGLRVSERELFAVVRAAFAQRRKTLLNALSGGLEVPRAQIQAAIAHLGWSENIRGETLSVSEFVQLANELYC